VQCFVTGKLIEKIRFIFFYRVVQKMSSERFLDDFGPGNFFLKMTFLGGNFTREIGCVHSLKIIGRQGGRRELLDEVVPPQFWAHD
jgi:hypothetical protein